MMQPKIIAITSPYSFNLNGLLYPISDIRLSIIDAGDVVYALACAISGFEAYRGKDIDALVEFLRKEIPIQDDFFCGIGEILWLYRVCDKLNIQPVLAVGDDQLILSTEVAIVDIDGLKLSPIENEIAQNIGLIENATEQGVKIRITTTSLHDLCNEIVAIEATKETAELGSFWESISGLEVIAKTIQEEFEKKPVAVLSYDDVDLFGVVDIKALIETQDNILHNAAKTVINRSLVGRINPFLERMVGLEPIISAYNALSDPFDKNVIIEEAINTHYSDFANETKEKKTDGVINRINPPEYSLEDALYEGLYESNFKKDKDFCSLLTNSLLIKNPKRGEGQYSLQDIRLLTHDAQAELTKIDVSERDLCDLKDEFIDHNIERKEDGAVTQNNVTDPQRTFGIFQVSIDQIKARINEIRGTNFQRNVEQGVDKPPIKLIAEICIAVEELFGFIPRDTQLLALLSLLHSESSHLVEVKTGEGKTLIIAMLAIIEIKRGNHVDIVTSAALLSQRDFEKYQKLYAHFGIEVGCNCLEDQKHAPGEKDCYRCSGKKVVYGDAQTFQADRLNNDFYKKNTFVGRVSKVVIVDEVDNAFIDKANWVCQISDSIGGMSAVTSVLDIILNHTIFTLNALKDSPEPKSFEEIENDILAFMKGKIELAGFLESTCLIPVHLHDFVNYRLNYWVKSALLAFTLYEKDKQYVASPIEKKIIPIDFLNTGEWEKNLQYSDGLHYFLNKFNGFETEPESLTKTFLSNPVFFQKYYGKLYGLSGTLGGESESKVFRTQFGCGVTKIPRFAPSRTVRLEDYVAKDYDAWLSFIHKDICTSEMRNRTVLVICKTIHDVNKLKGYLMGKSLGGIVTFTQGKEDQNNAEEATPGKIILATNLAGRGTDIEAKDIEIFGGVHVIFGFFAINQCVEEQGFGRTGRKGLSGTVRRVMQLSELHERHLDQNRSLTSASIDLCRENERADALKYLQNVTFSSVKNRFDLFQEFQGFFHYLDENVTIPIEYQSVKEKLVGVYKEYVLDQWAFYLDKLVKDIFRDNFETFKSQLTQNLDGLIACNDLYAMQYANVLLDVIGEHKASALEKAKGIFEGIKTKNGICSGFACYNLLFIQLSNPNRGYDDAIKLLKEAKTKFKENPYYAKIEEHNQANQADKTKQLAPPLYRLLSAMVSSCEAAISQIEKIRDNGYGLYAEFLNPFEIMEKPSGSNSDGSDKTEVKFTSIPASMIGEAIKFGLKGPLNITHGREASERALIMLFVCMAVVIATVALMVVTAGSSSVLTALALNTLLGAGLEAVIYSLQGVLNNHFSFRELGENLVVGAVTGLVATGITSGLGRIVAPVVRSARPGVQWFAQVGVAGFAGGVSRAAGYLVGQGLSGKPVKLDEFGKNLLYGAVGGVIGGGGLSKWVNAQKTVIHALTGSVGSGISSLAIQGIRIGFGDQKNIDPGELRDTTLISLLFGSVTTAAQKKVVKVRDIAKVQAKLGGNTSVQIQELEATRLLVSYETLSNGRILSFEGDAGHMMPKIGEQRVKLKRIEGYCVEQTVVYQQARKMGFPDGFAKKMANNKSVVSLTRGILNATVVPERFEGQIFGVDRQRSPDGLSLHDLKATYRSQNSYILQLLSGDTFEGELTLSRCCSEEEFNLFKAYVDNSSVDKRAFSGDYRKQKWFTVGDQPNLNDRGNSTHNFLYKIKIPREKFVRIVTDSRYGLLDGSGGQVGHANAYSDRCQIKPSAEPKNIAIGEKIFWRLGLKKEWYTFVGRVNGR